MARTLILVVGITLVAGGFLAFALRHCKPIAAPERDPAVSSLREQIRGLSGDIRRREEENARLSMEIERLHAGPPSPAHQRIHETLLPALAEGKGDVCEPALLVLAGVDPLDRPCAEALLEVLRSARLDRLRLLAARALSMTRVRLPDVDRGVVASGLIRAAREDRSGEVRVAALSALDYDSPSAADLERLFAIAATEAQEQVRLAAVRALAHVRPAARGPFLARVEEVFAGESSRGVRLALVEATVAMGGEAASALLERLRRLAPDLAGEIDGALKGIAASPPSGTR